MILLQPTSLQQLMYVHRQTCAEDDAEDVSSMAFLQAIVQALVCQYRCLLGRKRLAGWAD